MRNWFFSAVFVCAILMSSLFANETFVLPLSDRTRTNIDFDWGFYRGDINGEEETHQVN